MLTDQQTEILINIKSQEIADLQRLLQIEQGKRQAMTQAIHGIIVQMKLNPVVNTRTLVLRLENMLEGME